MYITLKNDKEKRDVAKIILCFAFGNPSSKYNHHGKYTKKIPVTHNILLCFVFECTKNEENLLSIPTLDRVWREYCIVLSKNEDDVKIRINEASGIRVKKKPYGSYIYSKKPDIPSYYNGSLVFDDHSEFESEEGGSMSVQMYEYCKKIFPSIDYNSWGRYCNCINFPNKDKFEYVLSKSNQRLIQSEYIEVVEKRKKKKEYEKIKKLAVKDSYLICREVPSYPTRIETRETIHCKDFKKNKVRRMYQFDIPPPPPPLDSSVHEASDSRGSILIDRDGMNAYFSEKPSSEFQHSSPKYEDLTKLKPSNRIHQVSSRDEKYKKKKSLVMCFPHGGCSTDKKVMGFKSGDVSGEYVFHSQFPTNNNGFQNLIQDNNHPRISGGKARTLLLHYDIKVPPEYEHPKSPVVDTVNGNMAITFFERKVKRPKTNNNMTPQTRKQVNLFNDSFESPDINLSSASSVPDEDEDDDEQEDTTDRTLFRNTDTETGVTEDSTPLFVKDIDRGSILKARIQVDEEKEVGIVIVMKIIEKDKFEVYCCDQDQDGDILGLVDEIESDDIVEVIELDIESGCEVEGMEFELVRGAEGRTFAVSKESGKVMFTGNYFEFGDPDYVDPITRIKGDKLHGKSVPHGWSKVHVVIPKGEQILLNCQKSFGNDTIESYKNSYMMWPRQCLKKRKKRKKMKKKKKSRKRKRE